MTIHRHWIGYDHRGPATLRNIRQDITGEPVLLLDEGEVRTVVMDLTSYLAGETISSATAAAEGCTASIATASPLITLTISNATAYDIEGKVTLTITLSGGEVRKDTIRVRRIDRYAAENPVSDYT
ncbi:MAG: hypothetical protein E6Q97_16820 [Desulfurellales bacterium]|nr:MAG: hypothetical protein E6Q97_16820 [Desulfurellales bacterium]